MVTESPVDVDRYLARIGLDAPPPVDFDGLAALQFAHLTAVPFENLDVFDGVPVRVDTEWSINKIVNDKRGGWCFELNGAFAALLDALGFDVALLGAAVLVDGPSVVVDHATLEVRLDESYLVDVGFGDSFIQPLRLNQAGPQDGGSGTFELIASPQGTTLTRHDAGGVPEPQYRFKRTHRDIGEFAPSSSALTADPSTRWHTKAIATRLIGDRADRVTLTGTTLTRSIDGVKTSSTIELGDIDQVLKTEFAIARRTSGGEFSIPSA